MDRPATSAMASQNVARMRQNSDRTGILHGRIRLTREAWPDRWLVGSCSVVCLVCRRIGGRGAHGPARVLVSVLLIALGFPLEGLGTFVALGFHLAVELVELLLLLGIEQLADVLVGLFLAVSQLLGHGLALAFGQFVQVALGDLVAAFHLLAHQLAHVAALFLAQVQLLEHVRRGVLAAMVALSC